MNSKIILALASIGILLGSTLLSAQVTDDAGEADRQSAEQAEPPPREGAPAQARENNSDNRTPSRAPSRDPSEYQSSEQISEDLSVSFPVDI